MSDHHNVVLYGNLLIQLSQPSDLVTKFTIHQHGSHNKVSSATSIDNPLYVIGDFKPAVQSGFMIGLEVGKVRLHHHERERQRKESKPQEPKNSHYCT